MQSKLLLSLLSIPFSVLAAQSPKRGLIYINNGQPLDNQLFIRPEYGLKWYHNYGPRPADAIGAPQSQIAFVPTMWGISENPGDISFLNSIKLQLQQGREITHVLSFNNPDTKWQYGGSDISPENAAKAWVANMIPLQGMGIKVSLPSLSAPANPSGWMEPFLANCSALISTDDEQKNCTYDFLGLHISGDMNQLKGRINESATLFPGAPVWVLEYSLPNKPLDITQKFVNESLEYLDNLDIVERYAYFGSFRNKASNLGPYVAMLDANGKLTDIGRWYLGVEPEQTDTGKDKGSDGSRAFSAGMVGALVLPLACLFTLFL